MYYKYIKFLTGVTAVLGVLFHFIATPTLIKTINIVLLFTTFILLVLSNILAIAIEKNFIHLKDSAFITKYFSSSEILTTKSSEEMNSNIAREWTYTLVLVLLFATGLLR